MKSNLTLLQVNTIESKLLRMKDLKEQITVAQSELEMLKEQVIQEHFIHAEEYKTAKGLLLATYKTYTEQRFNSKRFSEDHEDIYNMYREEKTVSSFRLK